MQLPNKKEKCHYAFVKANSLTYHIHTQPQSHGLCGATKATKTQELIIVIAVDSGTQTHTQAHSHGQTH